MFTHLESAPIAFFWKMGQKLWYFKKKSVFHNYEITGYGKIQQQSLTINDDFYAQEKKRKEKLYLYVISTSEAYIV